MTPERLAEIERTCLQQVAVELLEYIHDLEAQLAAARENYGRHHSWCVSGRTCDCARDAVRATATPPSPEVGE